MSYTHQVQVEENIVRDEIIDARRDAIRSHTRWVKRMRRRGERYLSVVRDEHGHVLRKSGLLSRTQWATAEHTVLGKGYSQWNLTFPLERLPLIQKRIEKLQRSCERLDFPVPVFEQLGTETQIDEDTGEAFEVVSVRLEYVDCPDFNGWTLAGVVYREEEGIVVRVTPAWWGGDLPEWLWKLHHEETWGCTECDKKRVRKSLYACYHEVDDEWQVMGKSCLHKVLGVGPSAGIVKLARFVERIRKIILDEKLYDRPEKPLGLDTLRFLTYIASSMRTKERYFSTQHHNATYRDAMYRMESDARDVKNDLARQWQPLPEDNEEARNTLAWAAGLAEDVDSDYLKNLRTLASSPFLERRDATLRIAGSMVVAHQRHLARERAKAEGEIEKAAKAHVGRLGERLRLSVKVDKNWVKRRRYDSLRTVKMTAIGAADELIWWTGPGTVAGTQMEEGGEYWVTATIKRHQLDRFSGSPVTVLSNVHFDGPYERQVEVEAVEMPKVTVAPFAVGDDAAAPGQGKVRAMTEDDVRRADWSERGAMLELD